MGWIKNFGDLYTLEDHKDEIIKTEDFGEKSFERLQGFVEKSRETTLNRFIAGMGIPMVGRSAGRIISGYFGGDPDRFFEAIEEGFDFTILEGFGETMHVNIHKWYADKETEELWRPLLKQITFKKEEKIMEMTMHTNTNIFQPSAKTEAESKASVLQMAENLSIYEHHNIFTGKTVVATGKLVNYTRDEIKLKILSLGAKAGSSVTKKTDYLIVGEKAGSKLAKAQELGVKILTEQEFEEMIA